MSVTRILAAAAMLAAVSTMAFAQTKDSTKDAKEPAKAAQPATKQPAAKPAEPAKSTQPAAKPAEPPKKSAEPAKAPAGKKVDLNTATAEELDSLPQIGPARAKAIIEARAKGKFKNWDDFVTRKVVPRNAESAIKDLVSF